MELPSSVAAVPGKVELWPFQPGIADAMSDPQYEIITFVKPTRVGYTTLLVGFLASHVHNDPAPAGLYLPTEDDCQKFVRGQVEPIFDETPVVAEALSDGDDRGRSTILSKYFAGGFLLVMAAKAARNFRGHNLRIVGFDECDAMEVTKEGNPIDLGIKRTDSFYDRKILIGSTPVDEETSHVLRSYKVSDQRIYEVPCVHCGSVFEILWEHIKWPKGDPLAAECQCPHCANMIPERRKSEMVHAGDWTITKPEVKGHAGFRMNSLISLLPNTTWGKLAKEYEEKKADPDTLQVFYNTRLAKGWSAGGEKVDPDEVKERAESFDLDNMPEEVLLLTAGSDVQEDRIETVVLGWGRPLTFKAGEFEFTLPQIFVLGYFIHWGKPDGEEDAVWRELDELYKRRFAHPLGGDIGISAKVVDSGSFTDDVYDFCFPRFARKIVAGKGKDGFNRPAIQASKTKQTKGGRDIAGKLFIVGVDFLKQQFFSRLKIRGVIRFSSSLTEVQPEYYEQLTSEQKALVRSMGKPKYRFERKKGKSAEALDNMIYATAARELVTPNFDEIEARLRAAGEGKERKKTMRLADFAAEFHR